MEPILHLQLSNFKCHSEYSLTLKPGQICLLSGDSGKGKTTIFQAIYWCLYGKSVRVAPTKTTSKTVTKVSLEFTTSKFHIKMVRATNPKSFKVMYDKIVLDGTTAQDFVDDLFGCDNFWISTSYLRQKSFNPLIKGTNGEKRKLLDRITFGNEHPDEIIDKCDKLLTIAITRRTDLQKLFESELQKYQEAIKVSGIPVSDIEKGLPNVVCDIPIKDLPVEYDKMSKKYEEIKDKLLKIVPMVNRFNELSKFSNLDPLRLDEEEKNLELMLDLLENEETRRNILSEIDRLQLSKTKLEAELARFTVDDSVTPKYYSDKEIYDAQRQEVDYLRTKELFDSLNVTYDPNFIHLHILTLKTEIGSLEIQLKSYEHYINSLKIVDGYKKKLESCEASKVTVNVSALEDARENVKKYEKLLREADSFEAEKYYQITQTLRIPVLSCPHCSKGVRISGNNIIPSEKYDPNELRKQLQEIDNKRSQMINSARLELQKYNKIIQDETRKLEMNKALDHEIKFLRGSINISTVLEAQRPDEDKLKFLRNELSKVENIKYVPPTTVSSKTMFECRQKYEKDKLSKSLEVEVNKIAELRLALEKTKTGKTTLSKREILDKIYSIKSDRRNLSEYLSIKDDPQIHEYPKLITEFNSLSESMNKIGVEWKRLTTLNDLINKRDSLVKIRDDLTEQHKREKRLIELKQACINVQHAKYAASTNVINVYLSEIVSKMYTKPIKVTMRMFDIVKKDNRIKPSINLHVTLDGEEIDVSDISGGEYDRLSIAITLALSKVVSGDNSALFRMCGSPLLLIDETFSSLPANDRDKTIETIVAYGKDKDKYIMCVAPNSSSNWYEDEILFE